MINKKYEFIEKIRTENNQEHIDFNSDSYRQAIIDILVQVGYLGKVSGHPFTEKNLRISKNIIFPEVEKLLSYIENFIEQVDYLSKDS